MGIETALITAFAVSSLVSIGSQIFGGVAANKAANQEADLQVQQAELVRTESHEEAERVAKDRNRFLKRQKLAFLKSGVTLAGSPLLVLEETATESQKEVDALVRRGQAQFELGTKRAKITRNKGRAALISGIGGAARTITGALSTASTAGLFGGSATNTAPQGA